MDVYLELPGYSGAARRGRYRHWIDVHELRFERPLLEKEPASFTVYKQLDSLSQVLVEHAASGRPFPRLRIHHVEGSEAVMRLRFDAARVARMSTDGAADNAMECVTFAAGRWQFE